MLGRCRLVVLDKTIEVACAPARAFALLAQPEALPAWSPWTTAAATAPGSRFRLVHEVCGVRLAWVGRSDALPHRRLAFAQEDGDFEVMEGVWDLEPLGEGGRERGAEGGAGEGARRGVGAGTRIHLRMHIALPFVLPRMLTDAQIARALSLNLDEAMFNLKSILEASGPTARERAGSGMPRGRVGERARVGTTT